MNRGGGNIITKIRQKDRRTKNLLANRCGGAASSRRTYVVRGGGRNAAAKGVSSGAASVSSKTPVHAQNQCSKHTASSVEGGSDSSDGAVDCLVGSALERVRFWEFNVLISVLDGLRAAQFRVVQDTGSDDLDRVLGSAMSTGHLHVHLGHGSAEGRVSVLLIHVDSTSSGQVAKDDAVVPDAARLLLENLTRRDDLTLDLADLVLSLHVVPEL